MRIVPACLVVAALLTAGHATNARAYTQYDIAVANAAVGEAMASLTCLDDSKPCSALIAGHYLSVAEPMEITIRMKPGNADLRFREAGRFLIVSNGEDYFHVNVGYNGARSFAVALYEDAGVHDGGGHLTEPVWRLPMYPPIAILLIAIRPHRGE